MSTLDKLLLAICVLFIVLFLIGGSDPHNLRHFDPSLFR